MEKKMHLKSAVGIAGLVILSGCASITGDSVQTVRIETMDKAGAEVADAECEISNEYGMYRTRTPGVAMVRRSSTDLIINCKKEGLPRASANAISRANAGMFGNILIGGGIGAIIDHSKGTAYTYPNWMKLTFGEVVSFDRSDDKDGTPSFARIQSGQKVSVTENPAATTQQ